MNRPLHAIAIALFTLFGLAYLPGVGRGFIKDDFLWIAQGRFDDGNGLTQILQANTGFYRPIVTLTFGVDEWLFGMNSLGYGLTNFLIAVAVAAAIAKLCRSLGLSSAAAIAAAGVWAFNFHGINMAVLWLSGRTSLLSTLFAVLAADAAVRGRTAVVAACGFLSFMAKEETLPLVAIAGAWAAIDASRAGRPRRSACWHGAVHLAPLVAAAAAYMLLRINSGAFTPATAPSFYQYSFAPAHLARTLLEYADRSATFAALTLLAAFLYTRNRAAFARTERWIVIKGVIWLILGFTLTLWLPIRSSLYAVFPSVGAALIVGAVAESVLGAASAADRRRLTAGALVLLALLLPVYWSRNTRWVELAEVSSGATRAVRERATGVNGDTPGTVVLLDDPTTRANFGNAFGSLLPEASLLLFDNAYRLWIEPVPPDLKGMTRPPFPEVMRVTLDEARRR